MVMKKNIIRNLSPIWLTVLFLTILFIVSLPDQTDVRAEPPCGSEDIVCGNCLDLCSQYANTLNALCTEEAEKPGETWHPWDWHPAQPIHPDDAALFPCEAPDECFCDFCGNNDLDPGEQCDTSVQTETIVCQPPIVTSIVVENIIMIEGTEFCGNAIHDTAE